PLLAVLFLANSVWSGSLPLDAVVMVARAEGGKEFCRRSPAGLDSLTFNASRGIIGPSPLANLLISVNPGVCDMSVGGEDKFLCEWGEHEFRLSLTRF